MKKSHVFIVILLIVVVICILVYVSKGIQREYKKMVKMAFEKNKVVKSEILTEEDIKNLPKPVQKYLTYTGVLGKEKVHSFRVIADGEIKMNRDSDWAKIEIEQNNIINDELVRLFYLRMNMFGIPVYALHSYTDEGASMVGKFAGLFTVINSKGKEMRISDTVTLLNDMCLFAPATLIDKRITWEQIDNTTVHAAFKTEYCTVTAILYFNEKGELINFTSEDRYYANNNGTYQKTKWTTPFQEYKVINGLNLPSYGEAIWNFPEGDYCYCKFNNIKSIVYNNEK
ncbi:DUF6544 family protein [Anaerosacchariphilus polymeriproducens]|uniref:Uncharacterized protein n=1 Tax=Anaerosacchariphilus polymeriproducens TaxID=1812858 RepID=A0A371AX64_9FIRM|nr:DUF6544 family protein [Anaerosacchariphilus polymeriproducens]RDU24166.1 hypothetical protein DWV06_05555 [Anaerosacchariphilus polymeriproducens]